jgi:hypothetical protein
LASTKHSTPRPNLPPPPKKIPSEFYYHVHNSSPLVAEHSHNHPVRILPAYFHNIHLRLKLPSGFLPSGFKTKIQYAILVYPCTLHPLPIPSSLILSFFGEEHKLWRSLIVLLSPASRYFVPPGTNRYSQPLFSDNYNLLFCVTSRNFTFSQLSVFIICVDMIFILDEVALNCCAQGHGRDEV